MYSSCDNKTLLPTTKPRLLRWEEGNIITVDPVTGALYSFFYFGLLIDYDKGLHALYGCARLASLDQPRSAPGAFE